MADAVMVSHLLLLKVAWLYLHENDGGSCWLAEYVELLLRADEKTYSADQTMRWVNLVRSQMGREKTFDEFIAANPVLLDTALLVRP